MFRNIFKLQSYVLKEDPTTFQINLNVLLECLSVFGTTLQSGTTPALKMYYNGTGSPVTLLQVKYLLFLFLILNLVCTFRLEESGVITDCRIRTIQFDPVLDYDFTTANVIAKIIMNSDCLKEIFAELDATSETVQFSISPENQNFRITTFGTSGTCHVGQYTP